MAAYPFPTPVSDSVTTITVPVYHPEYSPTRIYRTKETATPGSMPSDDQQALWNRLSPGIQAVIGVIATVCVLIIVLFSVWFCCGCCGLRNKRRGMAPNTPRGVAPNPRPELHGNVMPLHAINNRAPQTGFNEMPAVEASPPAYEESVPPRHQRIAGGVSTTSEEDEGIISDGKTPLSEIPFEDVRLDQIRSGSSSSQNFEQRHHELGAEQRHHELGADQRHLDLGGDARLQRHYEMGGDTRGHTNSWGMERNLEHRTNSRVWGNSTT